MPDDVLVRRYIPLSRIRAARLTPDLEPGAVGPAIDYSGAPHDPYSQQLLQQELYGRMVAGEQPDLAVAQAREQDYLDMIEEYRAGMRERAATGQAQSRDQQILDEIDRVVAEQQAHAQGLANNEYARWQGMRGSQMAQPPAAPVAPAAQPAGLDTLSFGAAFRTARKAGQRVFRWRGRMYTTQMR